MTILLNSTQEYATGKNANFCIDTDEAGLVEFLKAQHALRADRAQRLPLDTKWPDDGVYSVRIDRELI